MALRPPAKAPARAPAKPVAAARPPARAAAQPARSKFVYQDDPDTVVSAHATASSGAFDSIFRSGIPIFRPKEGENNIRILPRSFDYKKLHVDPHWAYPIFVHGGIGPDRSSYLCRRLMLGEACCLCEERRLLGSGDPEQVKALAPKKRWAAWLIDRANQSTGPQLWSMPPEKVEKEICMRSRVKSTGAVLKITHPEEGYDITFVGQKAQEFLNYSGIDISRESSPLNDDPETMRKWLDFIHDNPLDTILNWYEDRYIMQVYSGQQARPDEDLGGAEPEAETEAHGATNGAATEEEQPVDEGDLTPESIRELDEQGLLELCEANGLGFDIADYDNDLDTARESLVAHFFPDLEEEQEPEPEPEPVPPPRHVAVARAPAKPVVAPAKPVAARLATAPTKPAGGQSPADQAAERLRAMRARTQTAH